MSIPETVNIRGRIRHVSVSARGNVSIGNIVVWGHEPMDHWQCPAPWEKFKQKATPDEWQRMLRACYEEALKRYRAYARRARW